MRRDSFERFYFEKVALGEGCGCAEHVTRTRELDELGRKLAPGRSATTGRGPRLIGFLRALFRRLNGRPV